MNRPLKPSLNRRFARYIALWLLPLFAMRALVPAGFMLDASADGFAVVVCPGHAASQLLNAAADSGQTNGDGEHRAASAMQLCPFAVAAVSASADFDPGALSAAVFSSTRMATELPFAIDGKAVRAHPIRGPPVLS